MACIASFANLVMNALSWATIHQSLINRRLNAAASCNRQHMCTPSALKRDAKNYAKMFENGHEKHETRETGGYFEASG